ncbi:(2Fe-2S)-binding protein [Phycicoccus sp. CSK15P-2]|uniref:(2Fe-2S)-binding protein n=1 Tax=Phycicoccus sp. CSK15P-2 TaxID=2807627 RepID=UPI00194DFCB1|nr:(2Fe-2S)-binding protein [Phycicoccus sp. CSK15P-2]MBM6406037.1 (2Fe-2S)-binding protein [Phycicoccus sp. CSK15P-2]
MSARHAWLRFSATGPDLPDGLDLDPGSWQARLTALHARWYDGVAPPAVAAVFVLQWLLQVPAHTAAWAAATGPWRAGDLGGLRFSRSAALVPDVVRITSLHPDDRSGSDRLEAAEEDYRAVAEPLAHAYQAPVRLGPHVRSALVDDMWVAARQDADTATGAAPSVPPERASCCLLYALPGCHECAGCPRLRTAAP